MCSICKQTLLDFSIEHTESRCPLRNSRYCSTCAQYGHRTASCPDKTSPLFSEPAFVEQLIPPSILKEYNITTLTPLTPITRKESPKLLEIKDEDKVIAAYLAARSIKVLKGFTKRTTLEEYAKLQNKRVVYIK